MLAPAATTNVVLSKKIRARRQQAAHTIDDRMTDDSMAARAGLAAELFFDHLSGGLQYIAQDKDQGIRAHILAN